MSFSFRRFAMEGPVTATAGYAAAIAAGLLSLWISGAAAAGFSGADEPAHFLNSYFIALYASDALGSNPLAFATEFYLHYPKISIGHWPPAFYGLLSPLFLVAPANPATAFAANLFVSALPAVAIAILLRRTEGRWAAVAGAALWALTPLALEGQAFFMLDQALAACAAAALIAWIGFAERQSWPRILSFALLCALAILIKGNGWLLLLLPPFYLLLTGRWDLLGSYKLYAAALLGALLVGPWYAATAGISAEGFNHEPGLAYALQALRANVAALGHNLTPPGLLLALAGAAFAWRGRAEAPERWSVAAACLALILSTLSLQSLVPVDLDPRYMAPALPAAAVLIVIGGGALGTAISRRWGATPARAAALLGAGLLLFPGLSHLMAREPKADLRMEEVVAAYARDPGSAWLIDGGSGAEGAFIAALAVRDPALRGYAVRGSKLLADSNFMGTEYRPKYASPAEVAGELRRLGIAGVVLERRGGEPPFPHSAQLEQALRAAGSGYRVAARVPHRGRPGWNEIWLSQTRLEPNRLAIRDLGLPAKARPAALASRQ